MIADLKVLALLISRTGWGGWSREEEGEKTLKTKVLNILG